MRLHSLPTALALAGFLLLSAGFAVPDHAVSCEAKLQHIRQNAVTAQPDPKPTVLTEDEINDYIAAGKVQLPKGVESVRFNGAPGEVTAYAKVDFDKLTEGKSMNPLMAALFTGVHHIVTVADARGAGGVGEIHVQSVTLDGTTIPRAALEFLIEHFVRPKYPGAGLDSRFRLGYRIDTAEVGTHKLTIRQK
ncbi:MAG TPA: hypothetical protein VMS96_08230 [Terriglobales bacterium]|nr:hypothetical protein [Terriglobales bacterium]